METLTWNSGPEAASIPGVGVAVGVGVLPGQYSKISCGGSAAMFSLLA